MNRFREHLISLLITLVPAGAAGGLGWWLLATASGGWAATPRLLLGMACMIVGAIIIAFPVARLIAEPSGSLFYPGRRLSRPQPMYSIPQAKRMQGLYEEAMTGFEAIAKAYPCEVKPYIEMIDIAIVNLEDPDRALAILERGHSVLKKEADRRALLTMYEAIRTRLHSKPSN